MLCSLTCDTELVKDRNSPPLEQMFLIYSEILKEVSMQQLKAATEYQLSSMKITKQSFSLIKYKASIRMVLAASNNPIPSHCNVFTGYYYSHRSSGSCSLDHPMAQGRH